jgi:hypothetical protein
MVRERLVMVSFRLEEEELQTLRAALRFLNFLEIFRALSRRGA